MRTLTSTILAGFAAALLLPCAAAQSAPLDGIEAVRDEKGRMVYVNAPRPSTVPERETPSQRSSVLVYWSNSEQKWKPVPAPSRKAMRAARRAADEVTNYVHSQPEASASRRTAKQENPNYRQLASGRLVSNSAIDSAIARAAARHSVDPNLVRAVIKVESNFNPNARSSKGAMGLMQLMPATARQLNLANPYNAEENVDAGVRHLKNLLTTYKGDIKLSLAAYNAGQGAVARFNGIPHFAETQNYVRQITGLYTGGIKLSSGFNMPGIRTETHPGTTPIKMSRSAQGTLLLTNDE